MLLLLSFIELDTIPVVKSTFLEQHGQKFQSIFKGLVYDSYAVIKKVLEVCWSGLWSDPKVKRTAKIGIFNDMTISQVFLNDRNARTSPHQYPRLRKFTNEPIRRMGSLKTYRRILHTTSFWLFAPDRGPVSASRIMVGILVK
jgi:hypothetical protein